MVSQGGCQGSGESPDRPQRGEDGVMCKAWVRLAWSSLLVLAAVGGVAQGSEPRAPFDPGCSVARELRGFEGDLPQVRAASPKARS